MSASAQSQNASNQLLAKLAATARLLGKELHRLKLKRIDLRRADLRLGEKAYATGTAEGQAELVSRLDRVSERVKQLQQQERQAGPTTFGEKVKAFASKVGKAVQISALQRKRRRILRRLGANLRQSAATSSLAEETQLARGVADRVSSVETEISQLAPQTYPWARRPLLLVCLLLLLAAIGGGAFALRHKPSPLLAQQREAGGKSSLSDAQMKSVLAQQQTFQQQLLQMQAEASRREREQTQARIAAAERQYREQRERERAEVEKRQRDEAAERDRIAAERARQEEKQREEERRIAGEKTRQEQQAREADAKRESERQKAAAIAEHATKQNAGEQLVKVKTAAEAGDREAMFNLGNRYMKGDGVAKDAAEGVRWLRKAAEAGDIGAMFSVGVSYDNGEGVTKDVAEAVRWYRKAAEAGNSQAMVSLGYQYENGDGVAKDLGEAIHWYEKAAEKGNAAAMFNLGLLYKKGEGVTKDVAEAVRWYRKAADAGNTKAMFNLGVSYRKGEGVAQDLAEAERWYRKAADAGNTNAIEVLQALQDLKKDWDNMLVLHDGRHVVVREADGEFYSVNSMTDASLVKLTGADKEEAQRLLRERQSRPRNSAPRTTRPSQPTQLSTDAASAWGNSYRNAKFITQAEVLKRVGPVHLTVYESGMRHRVPKLEDFVEQSATRHGWKLVPDAAKFELVVNANLFEGRIMTNEPSSMHSAGYILIYTIWIEIELRTKANCRRGDEFVRLNVSLFHNSYYVAGSMIDPMHFGERYEEAFGRAIDTLFDSIGKGTDADDKDDEAAWTASLWPPTQDANMEKKFLAPLQDESVGSQGVLYGISAVGLNPVHLSGTAEKYINTRAIEQTWESELKTNGQSIDPSSTIRITHDVGTILKNDPGFYVNTSEVGVWQKGVVFNVNGELRRRTVHIWGASGAGMPLAEQQKGPAEKANLCIRLTAQMLAGRR